MNGRSQVRAHSLGVMSTRSTRMFQYPLVRSAVCAIAVGILFGTVMVMLSMNVQVQKDQYLTGLEAADHFVSLYGIGAFLSHTLQISLPYIICTFIGCLVFHRWRS